MPSRKFNLRDINGDVAATLSAAGTTQGTATAVTAYHCCVTTCAAGAGVILTAVGPDGQFTISNHTSNALLVYPWSGAGFNGATANLPASIPAHGAGVFKPINSTKITAIIGGA